MNSKLKKTLKQFMSATLSAAMLFSSVPSYAGQVTSEDLDLETLSSHLESVALTDGNVTPATHVSDGTKFVGEAAKAGGYKSATLGDTTYYLTVAGEDATSTVTIGEGKYLVWDDVKDVLTTDPATNHTWTVVGETQKSYWDEETKKLTLKCSESAKDANETAATASATFTNIDTNALVKSYGANIDSEEDTSETVMLEVSKVAGVPVNNPYSFTPPDKAGVDVEYEISINGTKITDKTVTLFSTVKDPVVTIADASNALATIKAGTDFGSAKEVSKNSEGGYTIPHNNDVYITLNGDGTYRVKNGGDVIRAVDGVYAIGNVTADTTITIEKVHTIAIADSVPGDVTVAVTEDRNPVKLENGVYTVTAGSNVTITVTGTIPEGSYVEVTKGENQINATTDGVYTINDIDADVTVSCEKITEYVIQSAAWSGAELGDIDVTLAEKDNEAKTSKVTITAGEPAESAENPTWQPYTLIDGSTLTASINKETETITVVYTLGQNSQNTDTFEFKQHDFSVENKEIAATCLEDGHGFYYSCANGCGAKSVLSGDKGEVMTDEFYENNLRDPATGHKVSVVAEEKPTCTEDGHVACYQCKDCKLFFASTGSAYADKLGENGKSMNALEEREYAIPAEGHQYSYTSSVLDDNDHDYDWFETHIEGDSTNEDTYKYVGGEEIIVTVTCDICKDVQKVTIPSDSQDVSFTRDVTSEYQAHQTNGDITYELNLPVGNGLGENVTVAKEFQKTKAAGEHTYKVTWGDPFSKGTESTEVTLGEGVEVSYSFPVYQITAKAVCNGDGCFNSENSGTLDVKYEVTKEPTCTENGKVKYSVTYNPYENSTDSEASTEWTEEIEAYGHDVEVVNAVSPTCEKSGTKLHYKCTRCGLYSANPTMNDPKEDETSFEREALGHRYVADSNSFTIKKDESGEPTAAVTLTCSKCDDKKVLDSTVDDRVTVVELVDQRKDPTCFNEGAEYYKVSVPIPDGDEDSSNDIIVSNEDYNVELSLPIPVDPDLHKWAELYYVGDASDSEWKEKSTEEDGSYVATNDPEFEIPTAGHWDADAKTTSNLVTTATCQKLATYKKVCSICGKQSDTDTFEAGEKAAHKLEKQEEVAATCYAEGKKAHWTCTYEDDKNFYSDDTEKSIIEESKLIIPKEKHTYTAAYKSQKDTNGKYYVEVTLTCSVCSQEAIDTDKNGVADGPGPEGTIVLYKELDGGAEVPKNEHVPSGADAEITFSEGTRIGGSCTNEGGYQIPYVVNVSYKYGVDPEATEEAPNNRFVFNNYDDADKDKTVTKKFTTHSYSEDSIKWNDVWKKNADGSYSLGCTVGCDNCDVLDSEYKETVNRTAAEDNYPCMGSRPEGDTREEYKAVYTASVKVDGKTYEAPTTTEAMERIADDQYGSESYIWPDDYKASESEVGFSYADYVALVKKLVEEKKTELPAVTVEKQCEIGKEWVVQEVVPTVYRVDGTEEQEIPFDDVVTNCKSSDTIKLKVETVEDQWKRTDEGYQQMGELAEGVRTLEKIVKEHEQATELTEAVERTCLEAGYPAYYACVGCPDVVWTVDYDLDDNPVVSETPVDKSEVAISAIGGHSLVSRAGQEPTCAEDGWYAYYQCRVCKGLFDTDRKTKLKAKKSIPAHGHAYDAKHVVFDFERDADNNPVKLDGLDTKVKATFTCINELEDATPHTETVDAVVTNYKVVKGEVFLTVEATCGEVTTEPYTGLSYLESDVPSVNYEELVSQVTIQTSMSADEKANKVYFKETRAVPEELTITGHGLVYITNSGYTGTAVDTDMVLENVGVNKMVKKTSGQSMTYNDWYQVSLSMGSNEANKDRVLYTRAYVTVSYPDANGELVDKTIYGDCVSNTFNRLIGNYVDVTTDMIADTVNNKVYFKEIRNVGTKYKIVGHGLLYSTTTEWKNLTADTFTIEAKGTNTAIKQTKGSTMTLNDWYQVGIGTSSDTAKARVLTVRAYVIVVDGAGKQKIVYGEFMQESFNSLTQK